jgi:hypothetical protein
MSNVVPFRKTPSKPVVRRQMMPKQVGYPKVTRMVCDDGELKLDPIEHTAEEVLPEQFPATTEPAVYVQGADIVLDLGDCTSIRTLLSLTPEAALAWGEALVAAATEAQERKRG